MSWLKKWWKRVRADGTEAHAAVDQALRQQAQADRLGAQIGAADRKVDAARRRTDVLAREVTKALGMH